MDTNRNTANNYQINTFTKGMNSDTSYDMIGADQYLFGLNIRITNNTLVYGGQLSANRTEGIVTPIPVGKEIQAVIKDTEDPIHASEILACASIGDLGVVIVKEVEYWHVYKVKKIGEDLKFYDWFHHELEEDLIPKSFSIVLHKEQEDVINLYIADGVHPVILMNMAEDKAPTHNNIDYLISNRKTPTDRFLLSLTSGRLKTQQLQYTYRFYKKHGTFTKLSPLTHKLQIIDPNRNKEQGNAEDTETSIGLLLQLNISSEWSSHYDHILIYRISYIKAHDVPYVYLIYDDEFSSSFEYIDKGEDELQLLTVDEFYALSGQVVIPKSIESNQGYLFAGNVKDASVLNITPDQVKNTCSLYSLRIPTWNESEVTATDADSLLSYYDQFGITHSGAYSYNNIFDSSMLRSLRRGEKYRYGVIYYNKYGARSEVFKIAEVETKLDQDRWFECVNPLAEKENYEKSYQSTILGVECNIEIPPGYDIIGYQIVRCLKTDEYTHNILQVALSRPSMQSKWLRGNDYEDRPPTEDDPTINPYRTPLYPNVYLTTLFLYVYYETAYKSKYNDLWKDYFDYAGTNVENIELYQAFAPEINIARQDTLSMLKGSTIELTPTRFVRDTRDLNAISALFEEPESNRLLPRDDTRFYIKYKIEDYDPSSNTVTTTGQIYKAYLDAQNITNINIVGGTTGEAKVLYLYIPKGYNEVHATEDGDEVLLDDPETYVDENGIRYNKYKTSNVVRIGWIVLTVVTPGDGKGHLRDSLDTEHPMVNIGSSLDDDARNLSVAEGVFVSIKYNLQQNKEYKSETTANIYTFGSEKVLGTPVDIKNVADVKNPNWEDGFSSVQPGEGGKIISAMLQYKSFTSNIGNKNFVNWVANGMYNLAPTEADAASQLGNGNKWIFHRQEDGDDNHADHPHDEEFGWIGPGPVCLLLEISRDTIEKGVHPLFKQYTYGSGHAGSSDKSSFGTLLANISHTELSYNDTYTPYYGFGNYFSATSGIHTCHVFDGDIYLQPVEFVNMFKAYDFNDQLHNLISGQVVYYIPMESRVNVLFDYGMNYRNTHSTNLMLEPGEITGIASQARPLHQYNAVYSDNNTSIEVFSPWTKNDDPDTFPHRICYSQLKTDGENIDNWLIFRPADFIDVDSRYGDITHLLTSDNTLYYWQNNAFGKLSVNERSLVKDENSNSIQLGTGGVLNRYDYLSTRYGMKVDHRAATAAEHGIYWIDTANKAIPAYVGNGVVNISEIYNVLNLVNEHMDDDNPSIDYDLLNYELLCKIAPEYEMIFNLKMQCCTSVYTRRYSKCLDMANTLYHLDCADVLYHKKANYMRNDDEYELLPVKLSFAINPQSTLTKVYDNQKMVFAKAPEDSRDIAVFDTWAFETDYLKVKTVPEVRSDRENNIWYPMPRTNGATFNSGFGGRLRGKWLKQDIEMRNPIEFGLSHILTKFRQSYS